MLFGAIALATASAAAARPGAASSVAGALPASVVAGARPILALTLTLALTLALTSRGDSSRRGFIPLPHPRTPHPTSTPS